jgi:hypothetical protein
METYDATRVSQQAERAPDLLTLDEGHFRTLRAAAARPFRLLPADSP